MNEPDATAEPIECITALGVRLGYVLRASFAPAQPHFVTEPADQLQVGYIAYPAGHEIPRHRHTPIERRLVGTNEVIVVRRGRCEVDFYDEAGELAATRSLGPGDVMVMLAGGHGFRMTEDTVLLEVKQGPYPGPEEKQRF